ncbi:uncharacterized protein ARMOST_22246 [Armillaria ostoyae]|uniref:Piwi domain-containing protein n=1 Tax=Armillaria ostoyae TaxID=47428 RepID=A0A284SCD5_ARMOS|nr:uncharacterized protein ARMOST_22246 [Armillaria ostoyae]
MRSRCRKYLETDPHANPMEFNPEPFIPSEGRTTERDPVSSDFDPNTALAAAFYLGFAVGTFCQDSSISWEPLSPASCHSVFLGEPPPDDDDDYSLQDMDVIGNDVEVLSRHPRRSAAVSKRCFFGVKVKESAAAGKRLLAIYKLMERDAASTLFTPAAGRQISIAQSYMQANQTLSEYYLRAGAVIPLERYFIVPVPMGRQMLDAGPQCWANIALKTNAKSSGVNVLPDAKLAPIISDPRRPTIVMDADVMHPAPGSQPPSYATVVVNIDSDGTRYIAKTTPQLERQEMIADLCMIANDLLLAYMGYGSGAEKVLTLPKRLVFSRDSVSEGEFKHVLDQDACKDAKINPPS